MRFIIDRLREPSTYAGIAALFAGLGIFDLSEDAWNQIFGAFASIAGVAAIVLGENEDEYEEE
jgi:hypothetical protein